MKTISSFLLVLVLAAGASAQNRIFNVTPETVAIWEFNDFDVATPIPDGSVFADLSGNGLDAIARGNGGNALTVVDGESESHVDNQACQRTATGGAARVEVANDAPFAMAADQDFSIELFVRREEAIGGQNWGILAGTWHSRTLLDDAGDPIADGAWYGYGFIRNGDGLWQFVASPINADGTFTPSFNEINTPPFDIPAGSHYIIASVDRTTGTVDVYVDGDPVVQSFIPEGLAFITPTDYEPARMAFLTGVDDTTRNQYRQAPTGFAIDAARVMRRTIGFDEAFDNWILIQDGEPVPFSDETACGAVVTASSRNVLVDECVELSANNSTPSQGAAITQYEWKIGDGDFEVGEATREISFAAAGNVSVDLRITDDDGCASTNSAVISVSNQAAVARISASVSGGNLSGNPVYIVPGDALDLDGSAPSSAAIPPSALICPIANGFPVLESLVTDYSWDLDGDGTSDSDQATVSLPAAEEPGEFTVSLTVTNEAGSENTASVRVIVLNPPDVTPAPEGRIFLETPDTVGIWEFNKLAVDDVEYQIGEILLNGTVVPDMSSNGLDAIVEANDNSELALSEGDPRFDPNTACERIGGGAGGPARVVVEDHEPFQFDENQNFSFELYVRRAETAGPENWGILAGTWHSRTLLDDAGNANNDGAWYGFGFIRNNGAGGWHFVSSPINPDGTFTPSFNEINTQPAVEVPAGSHYLVATVDRALGRAEVYLDGRHVAGVAIPAGRAYFTPTDYEPARLAFLTGEDDSSRGAYRAPPSGYSIDAARVELRALSADEILQNFLNIRAGIAVPPDVLSPDISVDPATLDFGEVAVGGSSALEVTVTNEGEGDLELGRIAFSFVSNPAFSISDSPTGSSVPPKGTATVEVTFSPTAAGVVNGVLEIDSNDPDEARVRVNVTGEGGGGDVGVPLIRGDTNNDLNVNLSDGINILNVLFLGTGELTCDEAADTNDDGGINLSDGVNVFNVLFLGTGNIPPPNACDDESLATEEDCASHACP